MSQLSSPPSTQPVQPSSRPEPGPKTASRFAWMKRPLKIAAVAIPLALVLLLLEFWIVERRTHSITDDGFVESHIVNVAPEMVSGRIVRFLVDENDSVQQGDIIAEIDPEPYLDRVHVAQARLDAASAEIKRQEDDLERLRIEVNIQIENEKRRLAAGERSE